MEKQDFVKGLKKVKIVLGNGFDLHCGLYTKYIDYYCKNFEKYFRIKELFTTFKETRKADECFSEEDIKTISTWDVFFALNGQDDPRKNINNWCDIEKLISDSLISLEYNTSCIDKIVASIGSNIQWDTIYDLITHNQQGSNDFDIFVVQFVQKRASFLQINCLDFYSFLLIELKKFEKDFGDFVYRQFHDKDLEKFNYNSQVFLNKQYLAAAISTINELCFIDNLVSIDSFNYTKIEKCDLLQKFQNINGSYENPIFGIDTKFNPDNPKYIFTKTSRRIDFDMIDKTFERKPDFENALIYGHSLNEADYSYFFPLFDKLNFIDSTANNVLVFAYSIFDETKKEEIESALRKSISKIIFEYAKSKNIPNPERLLDSLSIQKRICTYLVDDIKNKYLKTNLDREWDDIYRNIDLKIKTFK